MNAAHTPGPWYAGQLRTQGAKPGSDGCDIGAENGANVALALHQSTDREPKETIANARLIAAAPQMLAALQKMNAACAVIPESIEGYLEPLSDALVEARFAIAKATVAK